MKYLFLFLTLPALAKPCAVPLALDTWHSQCWESCNREAGAIQDLFLVASQDIYTAAVAWNETHTKCTKSCNRTLYKRLGANCTRAIFP